MDKPLESLASADISALVDNRVREGKTIEYKRDLPGASDRDKIRFLRAVSSFANASGGDLLYGVEARNGLPEAILGVCANLEDDTKLRLENLCRDGLQPRIPNLQLRFVPAIGEDRAILVIRVARSWKAPHRVVLNGHGHFYSRNSAGSYQLDADELKAAFTLSETIAERIQSFRADRVAAITANQTPMLLDNGGRLALHIVPHSAFTSPQLLEMNAVWHPSIHEIKPLPSLTHSFETYFVPQFRYRLNFDGWLIYCPAEADVSTQPSPYYDDSASASYAQVYRSGAIEMVTVLPARDASHIFPDYEWESAKLLPQLLKMYRELQIDPPIHLFLTLIGIRGYRLAIDHEKLGIHESPKADRDTFLFPEVLLEALDVDAAAALSPLFDHLWNAFSYARDGGDGEFMRYFVRRCHPILSKFK